MADGRSFRHQLCGESCLHAIPVGTAKSASSFSGHPGGLGDDHLDDGGRLAALQMGGRGTGAVFRVGLDCDRAAIEYYMDELGNMIRLGLCCIFRDQPIKFRTTTARAGFKTS